MLAFLPRFFSLKVNRKHIHVPFHADNLMPEIPWAVECHWNRVEDIKEWSLKNLGYMPKVYRFTKGEGRRHTYKAKFVTPMDAAHFRLRWL